jgi:hypothetical protein
MERVLGPGFHRLHRQLCEIRVIRGPDSSNFKIYSCGAKFAQVRGVPDQYNEQHDTGEDARLQTSQRKHEC